MNYARVIVAGGWGGASGDSAYIDPGGFGGGLRGGNCSFKSELQNQGAGTQTGSSNGISNPNSNGRQGDPGQFGLGATGKYSSGRDSGGGGGDWYGCGSGGHGYYAFCSSGGGGSCWAFTESHFKTWESGDLINS